MNKLMLTLVASWTLPMFAMVELGTPFTNGMVLQRGMKAPVWGKVVSDRRGGPSAVVVSFAGQKKTVTANPATGAWMVELEPMEASKESRQLKVTEMRKGKTVNEVTVKDVLVGEVWLCSGQSNADCPIWGDNPRYRDGWGSMMLTSVNKPFVRMVKTPFAASIEPNVKYKAEWMKMTPAMYESFKSGKRLPSAMGYYYALELANALDVPIGLIDSSYGGSNIDAWTPRSGYAGLPELEQERNWQMIEPSKWKPENRKGPVNDFNQQPSVRWNGMVAAYVPMACRGFIWYQGCHNAGEYARYASKMHALYNGWSAEFRNPSLKLYFVQLAPWGSVGIANIQMAQAKFAAEEKNAAMVVINDVGNIGDIHPNDKRTVAKRLALHALKRDYGWDFVRDNSPTLKEWRIEGDRFVLSFDDADGWYVYNPKRSMNVGFEVCGTNGVWKAAKIVNLVESKSRDGKIVWNGRLEGDKVIVSADAVKEPVKLRYLHSAPWFGALYNDAGLPLGAFSIDGETGR